MRTSSGRWARKGGASSRLGYSASVRRWFRRPFLQSDLISDDEFTTKWDTAVLVESALSNTPQIGRLPLRIFAVSLLLHTSIFPLCGTSNRPCRTIRRPLSHARTLEGKTHQAVSIRHRSRHEGPRQAVTQVRESPGGQRWLMLNGVNPVS